MPAASRVPSHVWLLAAALSLSLWAPPEIHPLSRALAAILQAAVAIALVAAATSRVRVAGGGDAGVPAAEPGLLISALAVGCGLLASAGLSLHPHRSLHLLVTLAGACAFYLGCRRWAAGRPALWLAIFTGAAAAVALWACAQAAGGMEATLEAARAAGEELADDLHARLSSGRPFGTLLLPAALGGLMAMAVPVAAGLAAGARGARRLAGAAAFLLFLAVLALSRSYGALAATAAAALWAAGRLPRPRAAALRAGALAALLVGVILFAHARRQSTGQELLGPQGPMAQRRLNWATALDILRRYPALGCGPGAYASAFVGSRHEGENDTRFAHSTPLQAAAEGGAWALVVLACGALRLWPRLRRARSGDPLEAGAAAGFVAFAAHNLVDFTAYLPSTLAAGLALAAVLPDAAGSATTGGIARPRPAGGDAPAWAARARLALLAGLALACTGGVAPVLREWRGEILQEEARRAARAGAAPEAVSALYAAAVAADPGRADLRLERAAFLLQGGAARAEEAREEARAAARADQGSGEAHYLQSLAWFREGEWAEAYLEARQAVAVHARNPRARAWLERLEASLRQAPGTGEAP